MVDELPRRMGLPFHRNPHAISLALTVEGNRMISRARKVSRPCGETFVTSTTRHNSQLFRGSVSLASRRFGDRGEQSMEARVVGQLRVKRRREQVALTCRDDRAVAERV